MAVDPNDTRTGDVLPPAEAPPPELGPNGLPYRYRGLQLFQKGVSGNPSGVGRKPGSRNIITEAFLKDLVKWHKKNGYEAIERVGRKQPVELLRIIAGLVPKDNKLDVTVGGGVVLGTIELRELEQRTAELLAGIAERIDPPAGEN